MPIEIILIGGSAGSFRTILQIIDSLPKRFHIPICITLHRLKHIKNGLAESVTTNAERRIIEPFDKQIIEPNTIYIAPSNYHLLLSSEAFFSLSTEQAVEFSRPSIDVMFASAAHTYKHKALAILLSGANKDGAQAMSILKKYGATTIVQDPYDAEVAIMPQSAIALCKPTHIFNSHEIIKYIQSVV